MGTSIFFKKQSLSVEDKNVAVAALHENGSMKKTCRNITEDAAAMRN